MPQVPLWQAALRCRCPRCGEGRLYAGVLQLRPGCDVCGLAFTEFDTGNGAASAVILVLSAIAMIGVFWVEFHFNPPAWVHAVLWPAVTIPAAILMMRPLKAALVTLQYRHRATEMGL